MKANIHPKWYPQAAVTCDCGHTFRVGATKPTLEVEVCSSCHPFFTGEMKYVDTAGRVDKFEEKRKKVSGKPLKKRDRKLLKKLQEEKEERERPKSLKEMLQPKKS